MALVELQEIEYCWPAPPSATVVADVCEKVTVGAAEAVTPLLIGVALCIVAGVQYDEPPDDWSTDVDTD